MLKLRKLISTLLTAAVALVFFINIGMIPARAAVDDSFTADGFWYTVLTQSGTTGTVKLGVRSGPYSAVHPNSLTVTIPQTVRYSGITYTVTDIGNYAFANCGDLSNVTIPDSVTTVGAFAFLNCISLERILLPGSVTAIYSSAFWGCGSLTGFTIPESLNTIGSSVFRECFSLASISVEPGNEYFKSVDGVLYSIDQTAIVAYPAGRPDNTFIIPDSVTTINATAFINCRFLTSVTIPGGVTSIGTQAFYSCDSLQEVHFESEIPPTVGTAVFFTEKILGARAVVPYGATEYGAEGSGWKGLIVTYASATQPNSMSNFIRINSYAPGQFSDVNENAWYGANQQRVVAIAYEFGLMKGSSSTAFNPAGNITLAEAITVAARVHSIYKTGMEEFVQGNPWYQVYVDYAIENDIIAVGEFVNYNRTATRSEMAYIFSRLLPSTELKEQNTVNMLPDVDRGTQYSEAILMLYRVGVLTGSDEKGSFHPSANITRAEAAAIISRVILPETRASGKVY